MQPTIVGCLEFEDVFGPACGRRACDRRTEERDFLRLGLVLGLDADCALRVFILVVALLEAPGAPCAASGAVLLLLLEVKSASSPLAQYAHSHGTRGRQYNTSQLRCRCCTVDSGPRWKAQGQWKVEVEVDECMYKCVEGEAGRVRQSCHEKKELE